MTDALLTNSDSFVAAYLQSSPKQISRPRGLMGPVTSLHLTSQGSWFVSSERLLLQILRNLCGEGKRINFLIGRFVLKAVSKNGALSCAFIDLSSSTVACFKYASLTIGESRTIVYNDEKHSLWQAADNVS